MMTPQDVLSIETWILLATVVALIRYYINRKWQVLAIRDIPHDPPSILGLGNMRNVLKNKETFFVDDLEKKKKFGKIHGWYCGFTPRITIWDKEVLKQIQIKQFSSFPDRQRSFKNINGKVLSVGLNMVRGEQRKRLRATLTRAFTVSKLKDMFGMIEQCTDRMVEILKKKVSEDEGKFKVKEIMGQWSLDCICSSAFGVNVHTQEGKEETKVFQMAKKLFNTSPFDNLISMLFFIFPLTEKVGELIGLSVISRDVINYFCSLVDTIVKKKIELGDKARVDFLKIMLENEIDEKETKTATKGVSRTEIAGNSIIMTLAAYEASSSSMIFVVYNLAVYKECQETLRQEISDAVEKHGGLNYEAINSMKYLMMCINESSRLYPLAVRNFRFSDENVNINGIQIPKGAYIEIPSFGFGRDPEIWNEPLEFNPDRFEDMSKIDPIIFQPFGAGPRSCIGMRFALMEMKIAICKIMQNFQLDVADDTPEPPLEMIFRGSTKPKCENLHLKVAPLDEQ